MCSKLRQRVLHNMAAGTQKALTCCRKRPSIILVFSETKGFKCLFKKALLIPSMKEKMLRIHCLNTLELPELSLS